MKNKKQIEEMLDANRSVTKRDSAICNEWVDALEWVLENEAPEPEACWPWFQLPAKEPS